MANTVQSLLTTYASTTQVDLSYFFVVSGSGYVPNYTTSSYFFVGKVDPWDNDNDVPTPNQSEYEIKETFRNVVFAKQMTSSNMCPVVPRIDWTTGTVYDQYDDKVNMLAMDSDKKLVKQFYVRNRYDQIFKCLSNNKGGASTVEPVLKTGNTEPSQTLYLSDGYKWIHITTIDKGLKKNFFDKNWMPLIPSLNGRSAVLASGLGTINAINVGNVGDGTYTDGSNSTIITITGDGTGASAYGVVSDGLLEDVIITNTGNNYSYSDVTVTVPAGYRGNNASANAIISPVGGHASDPVAELGCNHIMISVELNGTEGDNIPAELEFRQLGIIVNPELFDGSEPSLSSYNVSDTIFLTIGSGEYDIGETIYQGSSLETATYKAVVCDFNLAKSILGVINTYGTYKNGEPIYGVSSGTTRIISQYTKSTFKVGSGYMVYYENRSPVQRSINSNEQFRLVLSY